MLSLSSVRLGASCDSRAADERATEADDKPRNEDLNKNLDEDLNESLDEDLVDGLFFGKGVSAGLSRRVFERCHALVLREGYIFVRLCLRYEGKTPILQVVAERNDGTPMMVTDCATLSRFLSPILEVEGIVSSLTRLEVSSPGIERPLTRLQDFRRFAGSEIVLKLDKEKTGKAARSFRATLVGVEGRCVVVQRDEERLSILVANLEKARLLMVSKQPSDARR